MQYMMNGESELIIILPVAGSMDKGGARVNHGSIVLTGRVRVSFVYTVRLRI